MAKKGADKVIGDTLRAHPENLISNFKEVNRFLHIASIISVA